jgi:hypothetical protein
MPRRGLSEFVEGLGTPSQQVSNLEGRVRGLQKTTYYLRPEQAKALKVRAVKGGRTVSELARFAIDDYLARHEEEVQ